MARNDLNYHPRAVYAERFTRVFYNGTVCPSIIIKQTREISDCMPSKNQQTSPSMHTSSTKGSGAITKTAKNFQFGHSQKFQPPVCVSILRKEGWGGLV